MDLHKFALGKHVTNMYKVRSKFGVKMLNALFASMSVQPCVFGLQM